MNVKNFHPLVAVQPSVVVASAGHLGCMYSFAFWWGKFSVKKCLCMSEWLPLHVYVLKWGNHLEGNVHDWFAQGVLWKIPTRL